MHYTVVAVSRSTVAGSNAIPTIMPFSAILTDIEGTISSVAFAEQVLFPYARDALPAFVARHGAEPAVRRWLDAIAVDNGGLCDDRMIVEVLQGWIDQGRQHTGLQALQDMVWAAGYKAAAFIAPIYPDAARALGNWKRAEVPLYVYSARSIAYQQLLFAHSEAGDLTSLLAGWFDTRVGAKHDSTSYRRIAELIGFPLAQIRFLSGVVPQLDAAREAGLQTVLVDRREDNAEPCLGKATHGHVRVESFVEIA